MPRYDLLTRILHHAIFLLIAGAFVLALLFDDLTGETKTAAVLLHKSLGLSVLMFGGWRLLRRLLIVKTPAYVPPLNRRDRALASGTHVLLYAGLLGVPLAGWALSSAAGYPAGWFGVFNFPALLEKNKELRDVFKDLHETGAYVLVGLIGVHTLAALYHYFFKRDKVLQRMWP